MGKLIKYEVRKQRTARLVILAALAVGLLVFWGGLLFDNEQVMGVTIVLMFCAALLVLFYSGIEGVLVLNRDLRTKQSYMLWMVPKSIWEIMGAKFISSILQMLIMFALFAAAGGACLASAVLKVDGFASLLDAFRMISSAFVEGGIRWTDMVQIAFLVFLAWSLVIMIGFFAVILSRTVLVRSRFAGLAAVILFFVINFVVERGYDLLYSIPAIAGMSGSGSLIGLNVFDVLYYLVVCGILFIASSLVADKKLSV